jgi:hypothetical protein
MAVVVGLAVGLLLAGLLVCYLSGSLKPPLLATVAYWLGIVLAAAGCVLVLQPILNWIAAQLRTALGV